MSPRTMLVRVLAVGGGVIVMLMVMMGMWL